MALEGSLSEFGLADILQLIYFQRKTGVLTLEGKMDTVSLLFIDGNIGGAESKKRITDNRLGKILLKKGLVQETDLDVALEEQRKTGLKLGSILIRGGLVEKDAIQDIVQGQITETIIQLFGWKQGTYGFAVQKVTPDKDLPFSLDTQHLLMEGLRIVDEWSVIQGKITLDSLFRKRSATPPAGLSEEEEEVFACVDGENDVSTIIDLCGQDNFEVSKTLLSLLERGFIEQADSAPVMIQAPVEKPRPSLNILRYLPHAAVCFAFCLTLAGTFLQKSDVIDTFSTSKKIDALRVRIESFQLEHAAYPTALDEVTQAKDAWGRPFLYRVMTDSFILSSAGADGIAGTTDDIF